MRFLKVVLVIFAFLPIKYYSVTKTGLRVLEKSRQIQESMWDGFSRLAVKAGKSHE